MSIQGLHASTPLTCRLSTARQRKLCVRKFRSFRPYCSRKNVSRGVHVAIQGQSARRTIMLALANCFWTGVAALGAVDTCSAGIHANERLAGSFSLVSNPGRELAPCGIGNTLAKPAPCHTDNVQILDCDQVVGFDDDLAQLVSEVGAPIRDLHVDAGESSPCLQSSLAAAFLSTQRFICPPNSPLPAAKLLRGGNLRAIGERCERGQSHVNTDERFCRFLRRHWHPIINQQLSVPASGPRDDPQRLDRSVNWPQVPTASQSEFWNSNFAVPHVDHRLTVVQRTPASRALESRESGLLPSLDATEKRIKRDVQAINYVVLKHPRHRRYSRVALSPLGQHRALREERGALATSLVNLDAMLKEVIPNLTRASHPRTEGSLLSFGWIKRNCLHRKHVEIIRPLRLEDN